MRSWRSGPTRNLWQIWRGACLFTWRRYGCSSDGQEILVPSEQIEPGDKVVVRMGNMVPFDGVVVTGDGMVEPSLYDW